MVKHCLSPETDSLQATDKRINHKHTQKQSFRQNIDLHSDLKSLLKRSCSRVSTVLNAVLLKTPKAEKDSSGGGVAHIPI